MTLTSVLTYLLYALMATSLALLDWHALGFWSALASILAAIFLADLLSGFIHVYLDYKPFRPGAGIERAYFYVGPRDSREYLDLRAEVFRDGTIVDELSYAFKIHHWKPKAMNRKSYAQHAAETMAAAFPIALLSFALPPAPALGAVVAAFFVINTQFIHACIHDTPRSRFWKGVIRRLQRAGIIYSFATHMEHHRHGQKNFCLITGWANVLLNPLCALLFRAGILKQAFWDSLRQPDRAPDAATHIDDHVKPPA